MGGLKITTYILDIFIIVPNAFSIFAKNNSREKYNNQNTSY